MRPAEIRELFVFNAWANHRVLSAADALSGEQFTKALGSSFNSVRDTLAHICGVEWVWLERMHGNSPTSLPEAREYPDVATLRARWAETEKRWLEYVSRLDQSELEEEVDYKTLSSGASRDPRWQMMQHVVNHGTYHRGQVVAMLRQLGVKGVSTDLIAFYRERKAAAKA